MNAKPDATVAIVDDDDAFRGVLTKELGRLRFQMAAFATGAAVLDAIGGLEPEVVLLDLRLPDMGGLDVLRGIRERSPSSDVIMVTGHGSIDSAMEAVRLGAFDYIAKPCPLDELEIRIRRALERQSLQRRATLLERGLTPPDVGASFLGESPAFRAVLQLLDRVAPTDSTVLITGETGSGKEMAAKLIHARSRRARKPFVVVECAALQESLLQSELFGHVRGAFTGADRDKPGLFEVANGGTIFLDEIGEISPATQVKLLRVLDTSTFRRVGGTTEIHVDVRILAATNRPLPTMVSQHLFREDLYYRLRTVSIELPPLRQRPDDIALLAGHFAALFNERFGFDKRLTAPTLERLREHAWPGNVRELQHVIEAAMIVSEGRELRPEHLTAALGGGGQVPPAAASPAATPEAVPTLDALERAHIARVLEITGRHRGQTATLLGISERNLYRKLREYGLDR